MPLMADRDRIPDHFGANSSSQPVNVLEMAEAPRQCVRIGLINNMPDSALQDTESQFFNLLAAAAGDLPVYIRLFSLPEIPREKRGKNHIARFYGGIEELWNSRLDAIIVTGTEPRHPDLRQEPYWNSLSSVLDWAQANTKSAVLSCLAAHASVLHSDGIERQGLSDKCLGVFEDHPVSEHPLLQNAGAAMLFPHSRWNELDEQQLRSADYTILSRSIEAGVNIFIKQKRESLFVHFQGHPEYDQCTLWKEYRRDVGRFLKQERDLYPAPPVGYVGPSVSEQLSQFRQKALAHPASSLMSEFPEMSFAGRSGSCWRSSAECIYRNWLMHIESRKHDSAALRCMAGVV